MPDITIPIQFDLPSRSTASIVKLAVAVTFALLAIHLLVAGRLELMFDEAYYSLWARHLQWGYYDHPPLVALWIRISTAIFGASEFGIRALGVFGSALASLAVWLMARDLFDSTRTAAFAVLFWNAAPMVAVGAILVTPDTPLLFGWMTATWAFCRLFRTGDWHWWLLVGLASGLALQAKYTALFLAPGFALALIVTPSLRRWWHHPAPYAGAVLALAIFAPNIVWNAHHDWQTFAKQFGRVADVEWTLRFLGEFIGSQFGLLNPLTAILFVVGLISAVRSAPDKVGEGPRLLLSLVAPLLAYFTLHSLHDRVQGNWLAPLYPAMVLLSAHVAGIAPSLDAPLTRLIAFARRWSVPLGLFFTAVVYLQALAAPFALPPRSDPTTLLAGWRQLALELDALAQRENAGYVLARSYALTALLKIYDPGVRPVHQVNETARWTFEPLPAGPSRDDRGLFIVEVSRAEPGAPLDRYDDVREVARLVRTRNGHTLETYIVFRVSSPKAAILDPPAFPR